MIKTVLLATTIAIIAGGFIKEAALAGHCPKDVKKIEAAMSKIEATKKSEAKDAAAKGLALHKAGKHGESLKVLHEAMDSLGIKH